MTPGSCSEPTLTRKKTPSTSPIARSSRRQRALAWPPLQFAQAVSYRDTTEEPVNRLLTYISVEAAQPTPTSTSVDRVRSYLQLKLARHLPFVCIH